MDVQHVSGSEPYKALDAPPVACGALVRDQGRVICGHGRFFSAEAVSDDTMRGENPSSPIHKDLESLDREPTLRRPEDAFRPGEHITVSAGENGPPNINRRLVGVDVNAFSYQYDLHTNG